MTELDSKEPLSNSSDTSFIILGHGSLPLSINSEIVDEEFLEKNQNADVVIESNKTPCNENTLDTSCDDKDFSVGDIQEKLKELMRENNQLKGTLNQNNLAIKSQLQTFYMWQQEVLKTHETHKEKFLETKDLILRLRAENLNLKKQLNESFVTINDDDLQTSKKDDGDDLKQEAEKLKSLCEELKKKNEVLEMDNMKLRENLKIAERKIFKLGFELEERIRISNILKMKRDEMREESLDRFIQELFPKSEIQKQVDTLSKELEKERSKSLELEEKLEKAKEAISELNVVQGIDENYTFDCKNQKFNTLQSWVNLTEENVNNGEIKEGKCHLCQKEKTFEPMHKSFEELKEQFSKLFKDYKALQEQFAVLQSQNENKNSELFLLLQEELIHQRQENNRLQELNKELSVQCIELKAFKYPIKILKNNVNEERDLRKRPVIEIEEMEYPQGKYEEQTPAEQNAEETEKSYFYTAPNKTKKASFTCPGCFLKIEDIAHWSKHQLNCLDFF